MHRRASFDLVVRPWMTVRWKNPGVDRPGSVGLRDLLIHAHEIEALTVTPPPALSALYRLLYALTARITGLDEDLDGADWDERREDLFGKPLDADAVRRYFVSLPGRFDLFDAERPFLQDPRLADPSVSSKGAGVNKLAIGRPAGNNSVWFSHHWDATPEPLPSAEAVAAMLIWLYYGPSGRCASRTHLDVKAADVAAGPLRSSLSYHPEGSTLLETLLAGLTPPPRGLRRAGDPCPWEVPDLPDPLAPPRQPLPYPGPCSRLTGAWQHALLLVPDDTGDQVLDAYITWGKRAKQPDTGDAYVVHQVSKQGNLYARPAMSGRALWRDLDALLQLDNTAGSQPRRPEVLNDLDDLGVFTIRALGFEQDGKTKDIQFVSAATPPLLFRIREYAPRTARRIGDLRTAGEMYGQRLEYAAKRAWASVTDGKLGACAWAEHASAAYWPAADDLFWDRLQRQDFTEDAWRDFLRAATSAYDLVTADYARNIRTARAIEHARLELYGGQRKTKRTA